MFWVYACIDRCPDKPNLSPPEAFVVYAPFYFESIPAYITSIQHDIIASLQPPPDSIPENIAQANNEFAIDFYRQISADNKNQLFSPLSMYMAFSMLYEGARGNTAAELQKVFQFEPDEDIRVNQTSHLISYINKQDSFATLELANSMWLDEGFSPNPSYRDTIRHTYAADIAKLNLIYGNDTINRWTSDKNHEKISMVIVSDDLASGAVMVLANTVYFKGTWATQFDPENTRSDTFWKDSQNSVETEFMNLPLSTFNYTHADGIQILKMPYEGDRISMLVLLPDDQDGIKELEEQLSAKKLQEWQENLKPQDILVKIPKFTMETEYFLNNILRNLGVRDIFSYGATLEIGDTTDHEFSGISDLRGIVGPPGLYVSKSLQKAFVDVNEEGTEAAAATTIMMTGYSPIPPTRLIADHPFIFIIQDDESGTILFMGKMTNPTK